ncbi:MAG TPA: UPF0182 family protein [Acidobacteriaceae bacterium]|nr:UPF0182 family protein [Acidobacteriaceae bacterium]
MPLTLEANLRTQPSRRLRRSLIVLALLLLLLFLFGSTALSEWVDLLWFDSLGFHQVFWTTRIWQGGLFAAFALLTFALLYGSFAALKRAHGFDLPDTQSLVLGGQTVHLPVEPVLRWLGLAGSVVVALFSAGSMASSWQTFALAWNAPRTPAGSEDPIFGKPLSFFLFGLPAWQLVVDWLLTLCFVLCAAAVLFLVLTAGSRALRKGLPDDGPSPWRALSIVLSFLLLVLAANVYLDRFDQLLAHHTVFDGVTYTDAHITLGGLLLVCAALVLGAGISAAGALRNAGLRQLALAVAPAALCYLLLSVVGWYVSGFVVKPNELVRETPYIAHNIAMTRQAFGLDRFTRQEFPADTTVASADAANNQPTLDNIRLWDWRALQDTLRQVQEIRTYYDFPDIDIDRYQINGREREVMLAARELNIDKLPVSSRNWINEKLIYTHGYGVTMNTVNGFTNEGLPTFLLRDMPVQSTQAGIAVSRPEVYFGQLTTSDVYVKTRQQEFDYPQGQTNNLTTYHGDGGIVLGGFLRRALLALDRGDLGKVPFSDDIGTESRLLMRRTLRERVAALAPFLTLDQDPYLVIGDDGRLFWMLDAFTTSDNYPYATHYALGGDSVNYMRNSVKIVIDAYNGTTTFYAFDPADPILAAYRHLLPSLFRDAATMPAGLRAHIRYPELLFKVQSAVYGLYHMTEPEVFFNREDLWTVATESNGTDNEGNQTAQPMEPNFVVMKLPGGVKEEFVEILPFTPANRNNLIGWIAGRSDGDAYGQAAVYDFPKTRLVDGPQQIEARIDQNAQLSGQLTLWNQQGSHVLRGSLLVIPTGQALLYAEPIYLQAQQSPMPELRLVVLALQDKLAYGPTFAAALSSLFAGEASSLTQSDSAVAAAAGTPGTPAPASLAPGTVPADLHGLIGEASQDFNDYQRLTAQGKLGEAGQKLDELKRVLGELSARQR